MISPLLLLFLLPFLGFIFISIFFRKNIKIAAISSFLCSLFQFILTFILLFNIPSKISGSFLGVNAVLTFDKLSGLTLLVLTGATIIAILFSIKRKQNPPVTVGFYNLILLVLFGTTGVVLSGDLIQFYFFWESMLIPSWFLVYKWNEDKERARYIGLKFFIITHIGAVLMLSSILWINSFFGTTSMNDIKQALPLLSTDTIVVLTLLFISGFIVKLAIFPFHSWLPDAYTTSVTPVTLILVGVLTSIGIYGFARFYTFFPKTASDILSLPLLCFALINMVYGGLRALVENNVKKMIAYSSMSQMGYVLFGFASLIPTGLAGSIFNIFNQSATKLALFISLTLIYEFTDSWNIEDLGGLAKRFPLIAFFTLASIFSLVGVPPMLGFWPEILIFSSGFESGNYILTIIALIASVITVAYGLRLVRYVFFGPIKTQYLERYFPLNGFDIVPLFITFFIIFILGIYPNFIFKFIYQAVESLGLIF